tara:strand:+ start:256 stop:1023 length:768 start_codon:yes stop_codon:yes gene_type:complete
VLSDATHAGQLHPIGDNVDRRILIGSTDDASVGSAPRSAEPESNDMKARLSIHDLASGYGDRALFSGLTADFGAGSLTHVLGENGVGKTTFLRTLAGLHMPLAGRIVWHNDDGMATADMSMLDRLCYVAHENSLNGALTPVENLAFLMRVAGYPTSSKRICDVLSELGLARLRHRACRLLSAGQRRRVSLARLWLRDAGLWLLDEPAAALDASARVQLAQRIEAQTALGGIIIFTTHEPLPLADSLVTSVYLPTC